MNDTLNEQSCHKALESVGVLKSFAIIGTVISILGVVQNVFIIIIFCQFSRRTLNVNFLLAMAFFDLTVISGYLVMSPLKAFALILQAPKAYHAWARLIRLMYPISRMGKMCSTYTMIVAAAERYLAIAVCKDKVRAAVAEKSIKVGFAVALLFSFASHASRFWEIEVQENANCTSTDIYYLRVEPSFLRLQPMYRVVYNLWFTKFANVILPFLLLLILTILNISILVKYSRENDDLHSKIGSRSETDIRRIRLKDTTSVLIVLVVTYLVLNTLTLILGIWEFVDINSLMKNYPVYATLVQSINLCALLNCSSRLINYMLLNHEFRKAVQDIFCARGHNIVVQEVYHVESSSKKSLLVTVHSGNNNNDDPKFC